MWQLWGPHVLAKYGMFGLPYKELFWKTVGESQRNCDGLEAKAERQKQGRISRLCLYQEAKSLGDGDEPGRGPQAGGL